MSSSVQPEQYVSESDASSEDDEMLQELENELLGSPNFHFKSNRENISKNLVLTNFNICENGTCNFRDGSVLGKQTGVKLPQNWSESERVKIGIYLAKDTPLGQTSCVPIPPFVDKRFKQSASRLRKTYNTLDNECWVIPKELGSMLTAEFRKKGWKLSKGYGEMCGEEWPKFVIVATAFMPNGEEQYAQTPEFEVRSKEQSNKSKAARGLAVLGKRRRTPETEACEIKLNATRTNIIQRRSELQNAKQKYEENMKRFDFILKILRTCDPCLASNALRKCEEQQIRISKWVTE